MNQATKETPSLLSLGLAFVFTGVGFALPFILYPRDLPNELHRAPEILNLFCLVSWMGLSHFFFAYRGHLGAASRKKQLPSYLIVAVVSAAILFGLRLGIGYTVFSALAWMYFISHLLKAEMYFAGETNWRTFLFPLFAFSYFSFAMLAPETWINPLALFGGATLSCLPLLLGARAQLQNDFFKPLFLIATFLIGESLLWGTYRPFMTTEFRDGVYTVHVALASFYHYFKSYAHMMIRGQGGLRQIVGVNVIVIALGSVTLFHFAATPLIYLFGVQFFTVWVWEHQWMSDVFNWKNRETK